MTENHCRWAGHQSPRLLRSHLPGCEQTACPGCQPCPERHCRCCSREHVTVDGNGTDQTCATCIHDTRESLEHCWITPELLAEALTAGVTSEAAMLVGPAADHIAWQDNHRSVVNAALDADDSRHPAHRALAAWMADCRDERHPLWVLGTWEHRVRDHLAQPAPKHTPVKAATARAYLDRHLTRLAHDPDFEFDDLARELADCRTHLDEAARNSQRPETGAPCIACGRGELVKDYGKTATDQVKWTCPRCGQWWDDETYRLKVAAVYLANADTLTASQIAAVYRVPEATVRSWALRGHVTKRGHDAQRRQLYDVAEVLAKRDETEEATQDGGAA